MMHKYSVNTHIAREVKTCWCWVYNSKHSLHLLINNFMLVFMLNQFKNAIKFTFTQANCNMPAHEYYNLTCNSQVSRTLYVFC